MILRVLLPNWNIFSFVFAVLIAETEAGMQWPAYKCAFPCQNDGICNALGTCTCETGWYGVDCSMAYMNNLPIAYNPYFTRFFSYANQDYSNWNFASGSPPFQSNMGSLQLTSNSSMWSKYVSTQYTYVVTITAKLTADLLDNGVMIIIGPSNSFVQNQPFGIQWSSFTMGHVVRLSKTCNGITLTERFSANAAAPSCAEGKFKPLVGFDWTKLSSAAFRIQIVYRDGYIYTINVCTVSGCVSPFFDSIKYLLSGIKACDILSTRLGIGAGPGSTVDVFEVRYKEIDDFVRSFSLLYSDYAENWWVNKSAAASDPVGAIRLVSNTLNSYGSMLAKTPIDLLDFRLTALFQIAAVAGNGAQGFGIFIVSGASLSPAAPMGINTNSFAGLAIIVQPSTNTSCVKFSKTASVLSVQCGGTGTPIVGFPMTDNSFNLRGKVMVSLTVLTKNANSTVTITVCNNFVANSQGLCKWPATNLNLGVSLSSMAPLYLVILGFNDAANYDSIDVLEVKTKNEDWVMWKIICQNGGYRISILDGSPCICQSGWTGTYCANPICTTTCPTNARCAAPDSCACKEGWGNYPSCNIPKCRDDCPEHAVCVAPYTCQCIKGWAGLDCSIETKTLRTTTYGVSPITSISFDNLNGATGWMGLRSNALEVIGGALPNGAIRLLPSQASIRGAGWKKLPINLSSFTITGTVEVGRTGIAGDGFTIALMENSTVVPNIAYAAGTEYMIPWSQYKGVAFSFQPVSNQLCVPISATAATFSYNSGSYCFPQLSNSTFRTKFEFIIKFQTMASQTIVSVDICRTNNCYSNVAYIAYSGIISTTDSYVFISGENNPTTYDSFDVYEVRINAMVTCPSTCTGTNIACSSSGACTCQDGWTGATCQTPLCPNAPAANAVCTAPFTWQCASDWFGVDCSRAYCPLDRLNIHSVCTAPYTITCLTGWTGANCTIATFTSPYYAVLQPLVFDGTGSFWSYYKPLPDAIRNYYAPGWSLCYIRTVNSDTTYNGGMRSWGGMASLSDVAINATVDAFKTFVDGSFYAIIIATGDSYIDSSVNSTAVINWNTLQGLVVMFWPKTGQICFRYTDTPLHDNGGCQVTSTVTVNLAQKLRIGVVVIDWKVSVDVCTLTGCVSIFSQVVYSNMRRIRDLGGWVSPGFAAVAQPNKYEEIDLYEFLVYKIPYCNNQCLNGGSCTDNNVCTCAFGWTGPLCASLLCTPNCVQGVCTAGTPNFCNCTNGWTGVNCGAAICSPLCQHGGNCTNPGVCTCPTGWSGSQCQTPNCTSIGGCKNGGTCSTANQCTCPSGYGDADCSNSAVPVATCVTPCSAYGRCSSTNTCTCVNGWTDSTCSTPICSPVCGNGGTCSDVNTCICASGWAGTTCSTPICDSSHLCVHGTCSGPNSCTCSSSSWTGNLCDKPVCASCSATGGNCTSPGVCTCNNGWAGNDCSIAVCNPSCLNGGTCSSPGSCTCTGQWTGSGCETPICTTACQHGGNCTAPNTCSCATGWTNTTCQTAVCSNGCIHGTCTNPEVCVCSAGWTGTSCATPICDGANTCLNSGQCTAPNTCTCATGWTGSTCATAICSTSCKNNGTCIQPNMCNCTNGWSGVDCSMPICSNNPCLYGNCTAPNTCLCWWANYTGSSCSIPLCSPNCTNGGSCVSPNNCSCQSGWTGLTCQTPVCNGGCLNGGNCTAPDVCTCMSGWTGANCSSAVCSSPCQNGGSCVDPNNCSCSVGWTGATCANPVCLNPVCLNGGTCVQPNVCNCTNSWTDIDCSKPTCYQNPCVYGNCTAPDICTCWSANYTDSSCSTPVCSPNCTNGGICDSPNNCSCQSGWTGLACQTPICGSSCQNGGACVAPNNCSCSFGWTGATCANPVCSNPVCLNGGTCVQPNICNCTNSWTGIDCFKPLCNHNPCLYGNCTAPDICTCWWANYTGSSCSTPVCSPICTNGGTCVSPNNCSCANDWTGPHCETAVCGGGCSNGNCTGPNVCTCLSGWTGSNCSSPICSQSCINGGICTSPDTCSCASGWNGTNCNQAICSDGCGNGTCVAPGVCQCNPGWTGSNCSNALWNCTITCLNGGNCSAPNVCSCPNGWNGTMCEMPICSGGCLHGNCTLPGTCICASGWSGSNCNSAICNPLCLVNGNCTGPNTCTCSSGWSGSTCTTPSCPFSCGNGNCSSPGICTCISGWTGSNCSEPICGQTCANNGTCIAPNTCSCSTGWSGSNCSQPFCSNGCGHGSCVSPATCLCDSGWSGANCSTAMCSQSCSNGGTCVAPDTCSCDSGWTGYNCSKPVCSLSCQNGGTCSAPNTCSCTVGYNGTNCQFATCSSPCLNGGNCSLPDVCSCSSGWNGTVCETPVCNQGCANGGNCSAPGICTCTANWTGSGCTIPGCNPSCQHGGICTLSHTCNCPSGTNGTFCENVLCNPLCLNGGTCIGNNICRCSSGWSGVLCETLTSGVSVLVGVGNISDADFINNIGTVQNAVESVQQGTTTIGRNLTTQEIKAIISDVTSPSKIASLVQEIISNPFFDPPIEIFSDEQLDEQSEVLSTLNQVTQRMVQLADSLSSQQLTSLTEVLAKAADKAATLAVKGALAVQSAIMKSDRLTEHPVLPCTPLIIEKERSSLKEPSTLQKLDTLNENFGDFIDGLILATFHLPLQLDQSKLISGDFYSVTIHKTTLRGLSGLTLHSNLGGIDFPYFESSKADFVVYKQSSAALPKLKLSTTVLLVLTTYVSNVMNSSSPYNFPTVTARLFTSTSDELEWSSTISLQITSQPPDSYRKQYSVEKALSQCDPHKIQCDATTNADTLGSLATYPLPTNAGDFLVDISGDQTIPYAIYIHFNIIPTPTKHSWVVSVDNFQFKISGNTSLPTARVTYQTSGQLRIVVPQRAISIVSGQPVTRVIDPTPPLKVYFLIKRNFASFTKVDDLPNCACQKLNCEGFNLRINRMEPTKYYRRKRQAAEYQIEDLELESNSSNLALSFRARSLGTFTSDLLIAPNTIEFTEVIDNFDTLITTNWIVIVTMGVVLVLFAILLAPMFIFDRDDLKEWAFLPITTNSSHEKEQYLISVHCNGCRNYQLTPKVEIRLFGDVTTTHWRWLDDGKRKHFTAARPSNFIMTTYHSIGIIEKVEISVSSLSCPRKPTESLELDIDRVIVVDVSKGRKYVFPCQSKLSDTKHSKVFKLPSEDELKCFDYLLSKNYRQLLSDAHLWRSVFRRPIPSNWTRCERLACIFVALYLAMLSNAMFFGKESSSPRTGLNIGGIFRLSWSTVVTSLISCCIVLLPTSLIAIIFQLVKRRSAENSDYETIFKFNITNGDGDDQETTDVSNGKKKEKFQLPYGCLFVGWSLVFVCIGISIVMITLYSAQWGQEKSIQWLAGLFMELLQDLIFLQTAKVMILAVFRAGRLTLPDDGLDVGRLIFAKGNSTTRVGLFKKVRAIATGLGHYAIYVTAFAMVISATTNPYAFDQVNALKPHVFVKGLKTLNETVLDYTVIFDHLLYKIIPNFLNGNQLKYGLNFENADFYDVPNHDVVIIGPIRVRQIRSAPVTCPIQNSLVPEFNGRYSAPLANYTLCSKLPQGFEVFGDIFERRNFNSSWNSPIDGMIDTANITEFQEAWLYRESNGPSYNGELDTYGSFGYAVDLPTKLKSALRVVAQLRKMRWLDSNTAAVFIDFNLYNPQTNVFSVIKIVFESLTTGGMIYQVRRYPLKLYQYTGSGALFTIIVQAVWIILLVSHIVKLIYQIRKDGFRKFRCNQWNLLNVINLTVGVVIVGLFTARICITLTVLESLLNPDQFTSLDALSSWEELTFGLYGLGFFLAMMGFFQYLETNKYWAIVLATLSKGKTDMLSYCVFYFAVSGIFAGYMYLLVGPVMPGFSSFKQSLSTLFQRMIGWAAMTKLGFPDKFSMICSMMFSGTILLIGGQVFIIIITAVYSRISRNVEQETDWDAELAEYLGQEWHRVSSQLVDEKTEEELNDDGKKSDDYFNVKPVGEKTFRKFEEMLARFSGLMERFGIDVDVENAFQEKSTLHDKVRKKHGKDKHNDNNNNSETTGGVVESKRKIKKRTTDIEKAECSTKTEEGSKDDAKRSTKKKRKCKNNKTTEQVSDDRDIGDEKKVDLKSTSSIRSSYFNEQLTRTISEPVRAISDASDPTPTARSSYLQRRASTILISPNQQLYPIHLEEHRY